MSEKPYGPIDPNSQHQMWSRWIFTVREAGRHAPFEDVKSNAARWARLGFGSVGRIRVVENLQGFVITVEVEGPPAHDPQYVEKVKLEFQQNFVNKGWGNFATGTVKVKILAGDKQDGRPADQLIVLPRLRVM